MTAQHTYIDLFATKTSNGIINTFVDIMAGYQDICCETDACSVYL